MNTSHDAKIDTCWDPSTISISNMSNNSDITLLNKLLLAHNGLYKPEGLRTAEEVQVLDNDDEVLDIISEQNNLSVITVIRNKIDELTEVLCLQQTSNDESDTAADTNDAPAANSASLEKDLQTLKQTMERELARMAVEHSVPISSLRKSKLPRLHNSKGKRSAYSQYLLTSVFHGCLRIRYLLYLYPI